MSLKRAQKFFGKLVLLEANALQVENEQNVHENDVERKARISAYSFVHNFLKTLVEKDFKKIKEIEEMFNIEISSVSGSTPGLKDQLDSLKKKL